MNENIILLIFGKHLNLSQEELRHEDGSWRLDHKTLVSIVRDLSDSSKAYVRNIASGVSEISLKNIR